jgi:NAD(P)-dependent dehydrogenase (short-subunit alcohol dehydrogenase family)
VSGSTAGHALVTGGASGIGAAFVARLRTEGFEVESLDLVTGFDVTDPEAWEDIGPVDVACLNAGVLGGPSDPVELTLDGYRRAIGVNVDGVVLGVRRLARVMPAGGRIVCTASLAGLTAVPDDPVYALTKHAVVGFVRSIAPTLQPLGITANTVNPGMTDTNILGEDTKELFRQANFPLMPASQIADAVARIVAGGGTGECWVCQPGRDPEPYRFHDVPGPRSGAEGRVPPGLGG